MDRWTLEDPLEAFDEYQVRVRGVCSGTRRNYVGYVHAFFETVLAGAPGGPAEVGTREVVDFVRELTRRYRLGGSCGTATHGLVGPSQRPEADEILDEVLALPEGVTPRRVEVLDARGRYRQQGPWIGPRPERLSC